MNEQQSALAYGRAYELFSQIFQQGLTDEYAALLGHASASTRTHYGAEHYQLFVHNVFPYESIFLGEDGLLGGSITEAVAAFYGRIGLQATAAESADHISAEFAALAHLCFAELDAIEDQIPHQIQRLRQLQRRFLDEHLLRWLPAFVIAIEQQVHSIYADVVRQSFELVCVHRGQLGADLMAAVDVFTLPAPPDLLVDEKTSLRDIARYLLNPAYTGFFLSVDDIRQVGAKFRVPHGFGKRQQILTNLLRTASDYEVFPETIEAFKVLASQWQMAFEALPALPATIQRVWVARLQATQALLTEIERMAQQQQIVMDDETADALVASGDSSAGCAVEKEAEHDATC